MQEPLSIITPRYYTLTDRKFKPLSVARALAIIVLLHPGGPYSNTPPGGSTPNRLKDCTTGFTNWLGRGVVRSAYLGVFERPFDAFF